MKNIKRVAKTVGTLGLVGCAVMTSPYALAEDSGWYVGLNIGESRARIDDARIVEQLRAASLTTTSISNDYRDTGYKIFWRVPVQQEFCRRSGLFRSGQFGYTATTLPAGTQTGKIKLKGLNLDAVGMLPISGKFSAFGRIGINYAEARDSFTSTGFVPVAADANPSKSEVNYKAGVGFNMTSTNLSACALRGNATGSTMPSAIAVMSICIRSAWSIASARRKAGSRSRTASGGSRTRRSGSAAVCHRAGQGEDRAVLHFS